MKNKTSEKMLEIKAYLMGLEKMHGIIADNKNDMAEMFYRVADIVEDNDLAGMYEDEGNKFERQGRDHNFAVSCVKAIIDDINFYLDNYPEE